MNESELRILKYALPVEGPVTISTAGLNKTLSVDWQGKNLFIWVEAIPWGSIPSYFRVCLTGDTPPPQSEGWEYVDTAMYNENNKPYVVHVYIKR